MTVLSQFYHRRGVRNAGRARARSASGASWGSRFSSSSGSPHSSRHGRNPCGDMASTRSLLPLGVWWNLGLMAQFGTLADGSAAPGSRSVNVYHNFVTIPRQVPALAYTNIFRDRAVVLYPRAAAVISSRLLQLVRCPDCHYCLGGLSAAPALSRGAGGPSLRGRARIFSCCAPGEAFGETTKFLDESFHSDGQGRDRLAAAPVGRRAKHDAAEVSRHAAGRCRARSRVRQRTLLRLERRDRSAPRRRGHPDIRDGVSRAARHHTEHDPRRRPVSSMQSGPFFTLLTKRRPG